jgi:hypothetical protein
MHWINDDWKLGTPYSHLILFCSKASEELLIDFRELVGDHSGENLAHAVYDTLNTCGLKGRVSLLVVPGFCTPTLITHRLLPSMRTMPRTTTPWLNTWRRCCSKIWLNLIPQMSGCGACHIQFIWRHWRYANARLMIFVCNLICLAFESDRCGQRRQEGHLSRLCHCPIEQGAR